VDAPPEARSAPELTLLLGWGARRRFEDRDWVERPFPDREREFEDAFAVRRFAVELDELDDLRRVEVVV
jgi:hypothetical protein